jgi:hypothetical protein
MFYVDLILPIFKINIDQQLIRFLPAATVRNVMDISHKSLHVDACMPLSLEHFA